MILLEDRGIGEVVSDENINEKRESQVWHSWIYRWLCNSHMTRKTRKNAICAALSLEEGGSQQHGSMVACSKYCHCFVLRFQFYDFVVEGRCV